MITNDPALAYLAIAIGLPLFCTVGAIGWKVSQAMRRARLARTRQLPLTYRAKVQPYSRWYAETLRSSGSGKVRL